MIFYKNKNQSTFIPARLIFREKPAPPSGARPAPKPAPSPSRTPLQPLKPPSVPIETLKARLKAASGLDERRKLSLEILTTAEANQDKLSVDFARAEIERYCTDKRAEINKKYDKLVAEAEKEKDANRKAARITKLRQDQAEELARYTVEIIIASRLALSNAETMPEDEKALLLEASTFQETAIGKYRVAQDEEDDPDLYLTDDDVESIHGVSSESLTENYAAAIQQSAQAKAEDEDSNPDVVFYNNEIDYGSEYRISDYSHGYPQARIENRQTALEFLKGRGDKLHPVIKARIYVSVANSLLHPAIRDRDLELAKKFLLKAIAILEEFCNNHPQNFDDLNPFHESQSIDTTLGYAYYRYAGLLKDQSKKSTKPDEMVCQWYEKAVEKMWWITRGWLTDYIEYLLQFPNTIDRATEVITKHYNKESPELTHDAIAMILERLRDKVDNSHNFEEFSSASKKYRSLLVKYTSRSIYRERENSTYFNNHARYYELVEKWYSPDGTKEQREKLFLDLFFGPNGQDMANRYKSSPVTAADYKFIVEGVGVSRLDQGVGYWYPLEWRAQKIAELVNLSQTKRDLLYAHLLDDWAPKGKVDRKKALEYYRKALKDREELNNTEIADAIARCYRILNAPQSYSAGEYFMAISDIGERPMPTWKKNPGEKGARFEIEDPKDNLVVLFYDKQQNVGIVVNRYINVAAFGTASNKGNYLKKLAERKRLKKENKSTEKIDKEIAELEKKLTPEGIGDIYYFRIGRKGMQIHFDTVYHVKQKSREHLEYLEKEGAARAVNAHDFPFDGFSAATMGLYGNFHDLRRIRTDGWVSITDDDGNYIFLDDNNNIIQANHEIYDKR